MLSKNTKVVSLNEYQGFSPDDREVYFSGDFLKSFAFAKENVNELPRIVIVNEEDDLIAISVNTQIFVNPDMLGYNTFYEAVDQTDPERYYTLGFWRDVSTAIGYFEDHKESPAGVDKFGSSGHGDLRVNIHRRTFGETPIHNNPVHTFHWVEDWTLDDDHIWTFESISIDSNEEENKSWKSGA